MVLFSPINLPELLKVVLNNIPSALHIEEIISNCHLLIIPDTEAAKRQH